MDPFHERGSMDPVQSGGPWTPGPCFVLTQHELLVDIVRTALLLLLTFSPAVAFFFLILTLLNFSFDRFRNLGLGLI